MAKFTDYTEKTEPVDTDLALIYDTPAKVNKKFTFGNLWKWIAKKIVSEGISQLDTTNKTIPGAINELNSKSLSKYISIGKYEDITIKASGTTIAFIVRWGNTLHKLSFDTNDALTFSTSDNNGETWTTKRTL